MNGIVIKQANTVEGDRIVWIFTEELGIIKAAGKGALKTRGKTGAGSQFLTYGEFDLFFGRAMTSINRAEPKENFSGIEKSIKKFALASYLCEVVYRHIGLQTPDNGVFRLLLNSIYALSYMDIPDEVIKAVFEARFICEIGYMPSLLCCVKCGDCDGEYYFSNEANGVLCGNCRKGDNEKIFLSAISAWKYISECPHEKLFSFLADDKCIENLGRITERYLMHHTDVKLKSLEYYRTIK